MVTHRNGQPGEGSDAGDTDDDAVGWTLRDPNRRHVTLDNLADLADLASLKGRIGSPEARVDPDAAPNGRAPDHARARRAEPEAEPEPKPEKASRLKRQPTDAPRRRRGNPGAPAAPSADFFNERPDRPEWVVSAARRPPDPMMVETVSPVRSSFRQASTTLSSPLSALRFASSRITDIRSMVGLESCRITSACSSVILFGP